MDDGQLPIDPAVDAISPENATQKKGAEIPSAALPPSPKTQPPEPHQKETCTCRPDQTPWWKGTLEIVALSIGICGLIVYWNQLKVMGGQLTQMQGSSGQTDNLICLYRKQLEQLTRQAGDTHDLAAQTKLLAGRALDQANATRKLAAQAEISAGIAKESLTKGNRPWLGVDGSLTIRRIEMKTVVLDEGRQVQNHVVVEPDFTIKNFGNAPAFMVTTNIGQVSTQNYSDVKEYFKEVETLQNTSCAEADSSSSSTGKESGGMIYPDNTQGTAIAAIAYVHGGPPNSVERYDLPLTLVGCISYRDQFSIRHYTKFCFTSDAPMSSLVKGDRLRQCIRNQDAN
ncbi:MAG: hypothetical protein ABSC47_11080 [Terracidiphilus sp.]|jgi:hypothetical protein